MHSPLKPRYSHSLLANFATHLFTLLPHSFAFGTKVLECGTFGGLSEACTCKPQLLGRNDVPWRHIHAVLQVTYTPYGFAWGLPRIEMRLLGCLHSQTLESYPKRDVESVVKCSSYWTKDWAEWAFWFQRTTMPQVWCHVYASHSYRASFLNDLRYVYSNQHLEAFYKRCIGIDYENVHHLSKHLIDINVGLRSSPNESLNLYKFFIWCSNNALGILLSLQRRNYINLAIVIMHVHYLFCWLN